MSKNSMRPIHPGEILREDYLVPLGMSVNALSTQLRACLKEPFTVGTLFLNVLYRSGPRPRPFNIAQTSTVSNNSSAVLTSQKLTNTLAMPSW